MRNRKICLLSLSSPVLLCMLFMGGANAAAAPIPVLKDGSSAYQIVLNAEASPSEQTAAKELQTVFKACTGVELPIAAGTPDKERPMIVLGCGPVARELGVEPAADALGEQGYQLRTVSPHIVIAGTAAAGTLYGVYDFLETYLGVRWYAPDETKTPELRDLTIPEVDQTVKPAFLMRNTSYEWPGGGEDYHARMRDNRGPGGADCPYGVHYNFDGTCHSYFRFISPDEFFDAHPEYFSEIGGVRRRDETQLCLTNPEVLEIVTERMLKRMAERPEDRQHNFSQMDYYNYCQCPKCREINEKYGTLGGTQYWFLNQLAERTSKVYPNKLVGTLAYMYTEEPPKDMVMHPNVAVWLCHMFPSCDSHSIESCPLNADYKRRALAWSKACSHLYAWHYIVDFAHYYNPFPNFGAMAADMKFYKEIGVEGIYLQGMGGGGGGGEFSLLRPYYGMKLLWNPDQDAKALMSDFLQGYYGAAAEPIQQYITMLQDKVDNENIHMHLYTNPAQGYLPDEVMVKAGELFDKAEANVAGDEKLRERVRVARMPLTYAGLFPRNGYKFEGDKLVFQPPIAPMTEALEMFNRMKAHGFLTLRERSGEPTQLGLFATIFSTPMDAPLIQNEFLEVNVVPFLGGRAMRIVDKKSGQCISAINVTRNLMFPFCGGESTRFGGIFDPQGIFDTYGVVKQSADSISLVAKIGGFDMRRTITLVPGQPVLRVTAEAVNNGGKPASINLHSHTNLDLGPLDQTRVRFENRLGEKVERDMQPIIAGLREGEHYLDQKAPKGSWTLTGAKGLQVTQRFDDASLDFTWLYAFPAVLNDLEMEVWTKPVMVEPGKSAVFTHEMEITPIAK